MEKSPPEAPPPPAAAAAHEYPVVAPRRFPLARAAGELFTPAGWNDVGDRIDLDAVAGLSALTVD